VFTPRSGAIAAADRASLRCCYCPKRPLAAVAHLLLQVPTGRDAPDKLQALLRD
jgi:hypothetical protein